ncbi:MAG: hypothetical protein M0R16_13000 [Bacteroidales bacterium]|jgi:hypothetical protein|nr:hypothetical protein [Bacteroidales bacterium]
MKSRTKDILAIILIIILCITYFGITGTVTSGYHFFDDHEILNINNELSKNSFTTVALNWVKSSFDSRFLPLFYFHRVLKTQIFGNDFTALSVYNVFLILISLVLFYMGMRKMKYSIIESFCFLALTFAGLQVEIWWRLGTSETIGMAFLGAAFFFMVNCKKKYLLNTSLFCFFLICAALSKESFIIIIPAFLIFKIWYEKDLYGLSIKEAVLKNRLLLIPFIVMIISLLIIFIVVGTDKTGYAGLYDEGFGALLSGILSIVKTNLLWYLIMDAILFSMLCFRMIEEKKVNNFFRQIFFPFTFCVLIIVPNLILHAKSGMGSRYMVPSILGIALFTVSLMKEARLNFRRLSFLFIAVVLTLCLKLMEVSYVNGLLFTEEGRRTKVFLSSIITNYQEPSNVLLVAHPANSHERSLSLHTYLSLTKNIKLYAYAMEDSTKWSTYSNFEKMLTNDWYSWFKERMFSDMIGEPKMILFLNKGLTEKFFNESNFQRKRYTDILKDDTEFAIFVENT